MRRSRARWPASWRRFPTEESRLEALAEEAAFSRVLGGIHYRFDGDAGLALGCSVAAWTPANGIHRP